MALLTEQEKKHLTTDEPLNKKTLTKLSSKLSGRMAAAINDMELILDSPHLATWRALNSDELTQESVEQFARLAYKLKSMKFKPAYVFPVKFFGKGPERRYWIDYNEPSTIRSARIFEPEFALRRIKNETVISDLKNPLVDGIIPHYRVDALTLEQIKLNHRGGIRYEPKPIDIVNAIPELRNLKEKLNPEVTDEKMKILIQYRESFRRIQDAAEDAIDNLSSNYNEYLRSQGFTQKIHELVAEAAKS
jgi:hypothetical protein